MTRATPLVAFGLYALTIKQDATLDCSDLQSFSKLADLKTGNVTRRPYITFEPDFWLLDGGYKFQPVNETVVHVGLMSSSMSDASGNFSVAPVLTANFSNIHTTNGLTIRGNQYSNDYPSSVTIAFYDASNALIRSDIYSPTSWEFSTNQAVDDFKKIVITFNSTNKPYRYLRMTGVDFGKLTYFSGSDIKSAVVVEEVDPLSIKLPIDTFELSLFSSESTFSIINPSGDYSMLQNKQPLAVYEIVGNDQVFIGQFYLEKWENPSDNEISFSCVDNIGILDTLPYMGGLWTSPVLLEDLLLSIMSDANVSYDLDTALYGTEVQGWIPVCTYREALQQIAFASGAYVTCSRAGIIQIIKTTLAADLTSYEYAITKAEKGLDQSLTLKALVTGVELVAHNYVSNTDVKELYNGYLAVGIHTVTFGQPMHDLSVSGGTITESGANYAVITVAVAGTIVLTGQGYSDTLQLKSVYNTTLDANVNKNILSIDKATLVNINNGDVIVQRVYDYYQQRYLQKVKLYSPTSEVGKSVLVDTLYNQQIGGVTEKMTLDLAGGFTVKSEIVGVVI